MYNYTKDKPKEDTMPRLSITLTESQAAALDAIAAETGATKQSMIGLAISAWIRENDHLTAESAKTPEIASQEPEDIQDFEPTPTYCEVCGKPADWASFEDDGTEDGTEHYFCDEHGMSDLRKPVDLGEDSEQYARAVRFYRNNPELDWDGDL